VSGRPTLKTPIGFSWKTISTKNDNGSLSQNTDENTSLQEQQTFTDEDLQFQWMAMCNRMPQEYTGISNRMKSIMPIISNFPNVTLNVENKLVKEQIEQIQGKILSTLKLHLHNTAITLTINVAEHEGPVRSLTRAEQYELLEKENPSVKRLRGLLDLELA
jgi:DNA polymerase-3 subunit gamma/tau